MPVADTRTLIPTARLKCNTCSCFCCAMFVVPYIFGAAVVQQVLKLWSNRCSCSPIDAVAVVLTDAVAVVQQMVVAVVKHKTRCEPTCEPMIAKGGIRVSTACTAAMSSGANLYVGKLPVRLGAELLWGVAGAAPEPPAAAAWLLARSITCWRAASSGQAEP